MIRDIIKYVEYFFDEAKQDKPHIEDKILKSCLVYQYLYLKHFKKKISVGDILISNEGIGLIGPGNGCLTNILERKLGWIDVLNTHAVLHDAFGRFYNHYSLDRGYTYTISNNLTTKHMKESPLSGQLTGLLYCIFRGLTM